MDGVGGRASTASPTRRRDPADSTDERERKTFVLVDARTRIVVSLVSLSSPPECAGLATQLADFPAWLQRG